MKWVDADGIEHLHVLRSDDLDDVLREMATIKLCIQHARARAAKARQAETAPSTPRDTQASPQPANQPVPAVVTATDAASCPLHGTSRIKPSKFGGVYCAVKSDGDKWCSWKSGGQA